MAAGYIALNDREPFRKLYAYMDTADVYRANELFDKYRININLRQKWQAPDRRYRVVFCSVPEKQATRFEKARKELSKRMRILGYDDYEECWSKAIQPAEEVNKAG